MPNSPSPAERLLLDEAPAPTAVLVLDSPALSAAAPESGADQVWSFCDDAVDHVATSGLPGVQQVDPGDPVTAAQAWVVLPKSLDTLDEYAGWAAASGVTHLVLTARVKDLTHAATTVLERHFHQVRASRGRDKARVLHATEPIAHPPGWRPAWPRTRQVELPDGSRLQVRHHGAVFAGGRLDPGTNLLLTALGGEHGPTGTSWSAPPLAGARPLRVLDWGSGSGLLATWLASRSRGGSGEPAEVVALDRSWAGASSTRATADANAAAVETLWVDGVEWLREQPAASIDLVVSNPPFHQGVAKDSGPTEQLLAEIPRVLAPGGQAWLVHNSHLPWARMLRDHARTHDAVTTTSGTTTSGTTIGGSTVDRVAQDRQFTVTRLRRPSTSGV